MGTLVFQATLGGAINLIGPNTASTVNFTLPSADGTNGQALTTNGSGTLAFTTITGTPGGSTTQVQYNNAGVFAGSANLTFNGTTLTAAGLAGPFNGTVGATTANTGAFTSISSTLGINTPNTFGFKNRIINGDMRIDQRNAGASVTPVAQQYTLDRWNSNLSQVSKFSVQQNAGSVTPPVGFTNYLGVTSLSAYSITAGDYFSVYYNIEGLNVSDLAWGTANAKTVTLSFQVYSSLTGTFSGVFQNSASNRSYPFTYSILTANTWTTISVTVAGDTSGTWLTTSGIGISIKFSLGTGSTYSGTAGAWAGANYQAATGGTSVVGTNGATFYITGVQVETGSTATSFDVRDYGRELILCQRYYQQSTIPTVGFYGNTIGQVYAGTNVQSGLQLATPMRSTPSASIIGTLAWSGGSAGNTTVNLSSFGTIYYTAPSMQIGFNGTVASSQTGGYNWALASSAGGGYSLSAEL
jgi:hypothetical protein